MAQTLSNVSPSIHQTTTTIPGAGSIQITFKIFYVLAEAAAARKG